MRKTNEVSLHIPNFSFDLRMKTHGESDLVSRMLLDDKIWEAYETELMINQLQQGDCVLDIGANLGYYSLIASKLVGDGGKVFAFEPEQKNFYLLEQNIKLNKLNNINYFQAGLGNQNKEIDLIINSGNRGDHRAFESVDDNIVSKKNHQKTSVKILVGDEILQNKKVNFIKIDTQGYELDILQGLRKTITANQQHLKMIIEFWPFALKKNGHSADELLNELARYDFQIYIIEHIKHELLKTDIASLKDYAQHTLTEESQGFINLYLGNNSVQV